MCPARRGIHLYLSNVAEDEDSLKLGFGGGSRASFHKPSDKRDLHCRSVYVL